MADISALGQLNPTEALDLDTYKSVGQGRPFPRAGRYTLRAPESFPTEAFGKTKAGNLSAQIDPTIVGPSHEGTVLRFTRVSAKDFRRGGEIVSQVGDYLKACGQSGKVSGDPQEVADAIERTANLTYEAEIDWRVYAKAQNRDGSDFVVEGMTNFPKDAQGNPVPYVESPTAKDEQGNPLRLRANLQITRFYPAV